MRPTALRVTATRSCFVLQGGGMELAVEFLSPVEPGDSRRQSIPMSYVSVSARSVDDDGASGRPPPRRQRRAGLVAASGRVHDGLARFPSRGVASCVDCHTFFWLPGSRSFAASPMPSHQPMRRVFA
jgi:hypothetical protein